MGLRAQAVTLSGDSTVLDGLNSIQLEPIDLSTLPSNDETVERAILIPNEAKNVSGEETVSVRITIKGKQIKTLRTTNIVFVGVDEEKFKATSLSQQVQSPFAPLRPTRRGSPRPASASSPT